MERNGKKHKRELQTQEGEEVDSNKKVHEERMGEDDAEKVEDVEAVDVETDQNEKDVEEQGEREEGKGMMVVVSLNVDVHKRQRVETGTFPQ